MTRVPVRRSPVATARQVALRGAAALLILGVIACGGDTRTSAPLQPAASGAAATPGSPAVSAADASTAYFHDQLVVNGEDVQSDFGSALLTLGMNPRDLQQDAPDHAYQTVLQKVSELKDAELRRDMMRTFFGTANPR